MIVLLLSSPASFEEQGERSKMENVRGSKRTDMIDDLLSVTA